MKFSEYADAAAGTSQELAGRVIVWVVPADIVGGPNCPVNPAPVRVSTILQGMSG